MCASKLQYQILNIIKEYLKIQILRLISSCENIHKFKSSHSNKN